MAEKRFHYLKDGKPVGPIPFQELKQLAAAGQVKPPDMVWPEGAPNWIPASQVEGLFAPAPVVAAPPPPPAPAPAPAPAPTPAPAPINRDALVDAAMKGFSSGMGGQPKPQSGTDFVATARAIGAWLIGTLPGAGALAFVGVLFLCCGGCGAVVSLTGQSSPTKHAIADLEKPGKAPDTRWMEISDGYLFWPEEVTDITDFKKGDVVEKTTKNWHYVPLVSKDVADEWRSEFEKAGRNAKDVKLSYTKGRVFIKMSPAQKTKDFGEKPEASTLKSPLKGTVGNFKSIGKEVMKGIQANAKDQDADRMILINYNEEIPSSGTGVCVAIFLWVLALPWFAPLGFILFKRFGGKRPTASAPV